MPIVDKEKRRKYQKEWESKHPEYREQKKLRAKIWRENNKDYNKEYYKLYKETNRDKLITSARNNYTINREDRLLKKKKKAHNTKIEAINLKGGKCEICGLKYNGTNGSIFDFHHVNIEEKEFKPTRLMSKGLSPDVVKELNKCILLCSNCHRLEHWDAY